MPLTETELKKIRDEAEVLYPNQRSDGNDIYHANDMADAKQEAYTAAVIAERERAQVLVDALREGIRCTSIFKENMLIDVTLEEHCNAIEQMKNALNQYNQSI